MITVSQVLKSKGQSVWSVSPTATVHEALVLMAEKDVGALVVLDAGKLAGIISERDYARKSAVKGKITNETPVREIMTHDVITIGPGDTVERCLALMTAKRIRHLPVLDKSELVGVISIGDAVKAQISEQESMIGDLERYISGKRA